MQSLEAAILDIIHELPGIDLPIGCRCKNAAYFIRKLERYGYAVTINAGIVIQLR